MWYNACGILQCLDGGQITLIITPLSVQTVDQYQLCDKLN